MKFFQIAKLASVTKYESKEEEKKSQSLTDIVKGYDNTTFIVTDCIGNAFENYKAEAKGLSIIENWTKNTVLKDLTLWW